MLYCAAPFLESLWEPFRLLRSHVLLLAVCTLLAALAVVFRFGGGYGGVSATAGFVADMVQSGPDRKLMRREAPLVAYLGDDWHGDISKAATITFTPPEGSGVEATTWNKTNPGTGAQSFTFNAKGVWTVTLTFADNTTRTAHIDIQASGFMLIVK